MANFIAPIAIAIAALVILVGLILLVLKAKGGSIKERRSPKRLQVGFCVTATVVLIVLWIDYDLSVAIFPAVMLPIWIPLLTQSEQRNTKPILLIVALLVGTALLVAAPVLFFVVRN